jgi:hypothetical protein
MKTSQQPPVEVDPNSSEQLILFLQEHPGVESAIGSTIAEIFNRDKKVEKNHHRI